jgi:hypothetical protein
MKLKRTFDDWVHILNSYQHPSRDEWRRRILCSAPSAKKEWQVWRKAMATVMIRHRLYNATEAQEFNAEFIKADALKPSVERCPHTLEMEL